MQPTAWRLRILARRCFYYVRPRAQVGSAVTVTPCFAAELEKFEGEKDRLSAAVQTLTEEESRILADDSAESVIVKKLSETRTRRDVQSARLTNAEMVAG